MCVVSCCANLTAAASDDVARPATDEYSMLKIIPDLFSVAYFIILGVTVLWIRPIPRCNHALFLCSSLCR